MKKLIILFLFFAIQLNAQFDRHFYLMVGNGWSGRYEKESSGDQINAKTFRTSFMTGIGFDFDFLKKSSFETNLLFLQTGSVNQSIYEKNVYFQSKLTAFSAQLALAYKYDWYQKKKYKVSSKVGFITAFPIIFGLEQYFVGGPNLKTEFEASNLLDKFVYFPYYLGISGKFREFELGLTYSFCPSSDIMKFYKGFSIDSQSFLSNIQLELRYQIY